MTRRGDLGDFGSRAGVAMFALLALSLFMTAAVQARDSIGQPFASLVTDPFGVFSAVSLPSWQTEQLGIERPDRLLVVGDTPVGPDVRWNNLPAHRTTHALRSAVQAGQTRISLTFVHKRLPKRITVPIRTIDAATVAIFFGLYSLMGIVILWSGLVVHLLGAHREGARAYHYCGKPGGDRLEAPSLGGRA